MTDIATARIVMSQTVPGKSRSNLVELALSVLVNINERATEKLYDGISIRNMCWLQLHIVAVHFLSYTDTKLKPLFIHCL